jgi:hypothetical protein
VGEGLFVCLFLFFFSVVLVWGFVSAGIWERRWAKSRVVYNMGSCLSTTQQAVAAGNIRKRAKGRRQRQKELRREAMATLTLEAKNDALLASLPGRICSNGASNVACIYTQQGRKGTNQDAMVVWEVETMLAVSYAFLPPAHLVFLYFVCFVVRASSIGQMQQAPWNPVILTWPTIW